MDTQTQAYNELMEVLGEMESTLPTLTQMELGEAVFLLGEMMMDSHANKTNVITQRLIEVLTKLRAEVTKREEAIKNIQQGR